MRNKKLTCLNCNYVWNASYYKIEELTNTICKCGNVIIEEQEGRPKCPDCNKNYVSQGTLIGKPSSCPKCKSNYYDEEDITERP